MASYLEKNKIMFSLLTTNKINSRWVKALSVEKPYLKTSKRKQRNIFVFWVGKDYLSKI